jgi:hypothetical protein
MKMSRKRVSEHDIRHGITVNTEHGDIVILGDEIAKVTEEQLKWLGISREDLQRCFREGQEMMKDYKPGNRVRPIAENLIPITRKRQPDNWTVTIVGYSAFTDPLMEVPGLSKAKH